jgi:lysyl-tRNA synthetase class 1
LQWKVDWAARWVALGVDYEMAGKDLIDSVIQSGKIARVLGGRPPEGFNYEMFLDEKGEKISKSKGNGLSLEEWLRYGSEPSLGFYIYREPKRAKSLHIGVIPRACREYWQFRGNYPNQPIEQKLGNPVHHIHAGKVPEAALPLTYGLLLNLVSLPGVADKDTAWKFVQRYRRHLARERSRARRADRPRGQLCTRLRGPDPEAQIAERRGGHRASRPPRRASPASTDTPGDEIQNRVFEMSQGALRQGAAARLVRRALTKPARSPRPANATHAAYRIDNSRPP